MDFRNILVLGSGQIGKEIIRRLLEYKLEKIVIHNLKKKESDACVEYFESFCNDVTFVKSYGDVFLPYEFNTAYTIDEKLSHKNELLNFYYSELNQETLKKSTLYRLISMHKPDIIVDAMNSATHLGSTFNPDNVQRIINQKDSENDSSSEILLRISTFTFVR